MSNGRITVYLTTNRLLIVVLKADHLTNTMTMDFMFYDVPLSTIRNGDSAIVDIVRLRDSISKYKIPGEDGIVMSTEDAYVPALFETSIDGYMAYETRGMWEIKGEYMAGPFINYAIRDEANDRQLLAPERQKHAPPPRRQTRRRLGRAARRGLRSETHRRTVERSFIRNGRGK